MLLRHYMFIIPKRPRRYWYWTVCAKGIERSLFRHNRWRGDFDKWMDDDWVDMREVYWRVTLEIGHVTSKRRAKLIGRALSQGQNPPCRHATDLSC